MSDLNLGTLTAYMAIDASAIGTGIAAGRQQIQRFGQQGAQDARQSGQAIGNSLGNSIALGLGGTVIISALQNQLSAAQHVAGQTGASIGTQIQQGITSGVQGSVSSTAGFLGHIGANAGTQLQQGVNNGIVNGVQQSVSSTAALLGHIGTNAGTAIQQGVQGSLGSTASLLGHIGTAPTQAGQQIGQQIGQGAAPGVQQGIQQGVQQGVQGAAPAAGAAGGSAGQSFGAEFGTMLAGALGAAGIGALILQAMDMEAANSKLKAQLDLTVEEAAQAGKQAGEIFAGNYGESIEDVNEAIRFVSTNIKDFGKITQGEMDVAVKGVLNLASAFEMDLAESTRTVGVLVKTGMARDITDALDIITKGMQSPVNAADDLKDTFAEYSTVFRTMGLDGRDALGLLQQGLQGGARDSDQIADSLKELLLRVQAGDAAGGLRAIGLDAQQMAHDISLGGQTAKAATDQIIDGFTGITNPAQQAQLGVELFGTKAEDAQMALKALDLGTAASDFEALNGPIDGAAARMDSALGEGRAAQLEVFKRGLSGAGTAIGTLFGPAVDVVLTTLGGLAKMIGGAIEWIEKLPGPVKAAAVAVGVLTAAFFAFKANPVVAAVTAVVSAVGFLVGANDDAAEAAAAHDGVVADLASTIDRETMAITNQTREMIVNNLQKEGQLDLIRAMGLDTKQYVDDIVNQAGADSKSAEAIKAKGAAIIESNKAYEGLKERLDAAGISAIDLATAIATGDWSAVTEKARAFDQTVRDSGVNAKMWGAGFKQQMDGVIIGTNGMDVAWTQLDEGAKSVTESVGKTRDSVAALNGEMPGYSANFEKGAWSVSRFGIDMEKAEAATKAHAAQLKVEAEQSAIAAGALGRFNTATNEGKAAMMVHTGMADDMAEAYRQLSDGVDTATEPVSIMEQLFRDTDQAASDADQSLKYFTQSVNAMLGINVSAEEAQQHWNDAIRNTKAAFEDATKATDGNFESLVKSNGQIDTSTEAGSKLYSQMRDVRAAYDESTTAAHDSAVASGDVGGAFKAAQDAADGARAKFMEQAAALGINEGKANDMADALGIVEGIKLNPKNFSVNAQGVANAKLALDSLNAMKLANKTLGVNVDDAAAWAQLDALTKTKWAQIVVSTVTGGASNVDGASANPGNWKPEANGGFIQAANGLDRHSRIAKGGANILWAEPETGWEAYISGKPSQRQRNQNIMATTALKLGGTYIPPGTKRYASGNIAGVDLTGRMAPSYGQRESGIRDGLADLVGVLRDFTDEAKGKRGVAKDRAADLSSARGDQRSTAREQAAKVRDAEKNLGDVRAAQAQKVRDAEKALSEVRNKAGHTADQVKAAEDKLSKAKQEQGKATTDAEGKVRKAIDAQTKANNAEDRKVKAAEKAADKADAQAEAATKNAAAAQRAYQQQERHRAALVKLGHLYDVTSAKLDNAKDKLGNLRDAASSMSSSIADGLKDTGGGLTGESDKRKDVGSIINGLRFNQKNVMGFEANIKKLEKKGLSSSQLSMLAAQGFDGAGSTVATLAGASKSEIGQINKIIASTDASAVRTGKFVAKDVYGPSIARQEKVVTGFAKDVAGYAKRISQIGPDIEDAVATAMSKVVIKQDPLGAWRVVQKGAQQAGRNR